MRVSAEEKEAEQRSKEVRIAERKKARIGIRGYLGTSILDMNINRE